MHKVLIVRGEETRGIVSGLFKDRTDIQAHVAAHGPEALEWLQEHSADLLIVDGRPTGPHDNLHIMLKAVEFVPKARAVVVRGGGSGQTMTRIGMVRFVNWPLKRDNLELIALDMLEGQGKTRTLEDMELIDVVQFAVLSKRTAVLHVRHDTRKGIIAFQKGNIVHAQFDTLQGLEALTVILALKQGNMFMRDSIETPERTIQRSWASISRGLEERILQQRTKDSESEEEITESDISELFADKSNAPGLFASPDEPALQAPAELADGASLFSDEELQALGMSGPDSFSDAFDSELPSDPEISSRPLPPLQLPSTQTTQPSASIQPPQPTPAPATHMSSIEPSASGENTTVSHYGIPTHAASEEPHPIQLLIQNFCEELPGFIATDIVHQRDGLTLLGASAVEHYDGAIAGAYFSAVMHACTQATLDFGVDAPVETLVTTDAAYVLLRVIENTPYLHLLILHRSSNLGIARVLLRRYAPMFSDVLSQI